MPLHQIAECSGDRAGAADRKVDAMGAFEIVDQSVDAVGIEGVTADEERLNREGLLEFWMRKVTRNHVPDGFVIAEPDQPRDLAEHGGESIEGKSRKFREAHLEDALRVLE